MYRGFREQQVAGVCGGGVGGVGTMCMQDISHEDKETNTKVYSRLSNNGRSQERTYKNSERKRQILGKNKVGRPSK